MEKYIGVKMIQAKPMTRGEYNKFKGWTIPQDENPNDEGYLVKYSDDYISWSPKDVFEEAYRKTDGMTFGLAVEALKKGFRVCRKGWNGKGMFLFYAKSTDYYMLGAPNELLFGYDRLPWIGMKTADSKFVPWLASQTDILAEDWMIVE